MLIKNLKEGDSLIGLNDSRLMRGGFVVLKTGEEVGKHTTKHKEEVIVILEGTAKLVCENEEKIVRERCLVHIPENSEHNVINVGNKPLKYVYITASLDTASK